MNHSWTKELERESLDVTKGDRKFWAILWSACFLHSCLLVAGIVKVYETVANVFYN